MSLVSDQLPNRLRDTSLRFVDGCAKYPKGRHTVGPRIASSPVFPASKHLGKRELQNWNLRPSRGSFVEQGDIAVFQLAGVQFFSAIYPEDEK